MAFLDRHDELGMLGRRPTGDRAELLIVYVRRRVGETGPLTLMTPAGVYA